MPRIFVRRDKRLDLVDVGVQWPDGSATRQDDWGGVTSSADLPFETITGYWADDDPGAPTPLPRLIELHRDIDETGVSGTGLVAHGCVWPDGAVTIAWHVEAGHSHVWWPPQQGLSRAVAVHGHHGRTRFVWADSGEQVQA